MTEARSPNPPVGGIPDHDETDRNAEISKLGLDFGDSHMRAEAITEDGEFVWSNLSTFGQSLADKSARNPRGWKQNGGFNPFNVPGKKGTGSQVSAYDEAMSRMFAPALLEFRS